MRRRNIAALGIAAALAVGAVAAIPLGSSSGGGIDVLIGSTPTATSSETNTANLWIDTNGGTCTRQSTAGAYVNAQACANVAVAYAAASAGDVVRVVGTSYTDTQFSGDPSNGQINVTPKVSGPAVVFQPELGSTLNVVGDIDILSGSWMEFRDITAGNTSTHRFGLYMRHNATHISFLRVHVFSFTIRGASDITATDSEVGPNSSTTGDISFWTGDPGGGGHANNITLDNVNWHDIYSATTADHTDSIAIDDTDNITIRNSYFNGCENYCMIFGNDTNTGGSADHVLIENTRFDCCYDGWGSGNASGPAAVSFYGTNNTDVTFRFNSVNGPMQTNDGDTRNSTMLIDSNILSHINDQNCTDGSSWNHNVVVDVTGSSPCTGGTIAAAGWASTPNASGTGDDFHLTAGAAAIGFGNQSSFPATDFEGTPRTAGTVDAGADER